MMWPSWSRVSLQSCHSPPPPPLPLCVCVCVCVCGGCRVVGVWLCVWVWVHVCALVCVWLCVCVWVCVCVPAVGLGRILPFWTAKARGHFHLGLARGCH